MMNINEAIQHCKEKAKENRIEADEVYHFDQDWGKRIECLECAKDHEQLAEWLEELRKYRGKIEDYIDGNLTLADLVFYLVDIHMNAMEKENNK